MLVEVRDCTDFVYIPDNANQDTLQRAVTVLRNQNQLTVSFTRLNESEKSKSFAYLCGAVYAGNGRVEKQTDDTFLFVYSEPTEHIEPFWKRFFRNN